MDGLNNRNLSPMSPSSDSDCDTVTILRSTYRVQYAPGVDSNIHMGSTIRTPANVKFIPRTGAIPKGEKVEESASSILPVQTPMASSIPNNYYQISSIGNFSSTGYGIGDSPQSSPSETTNLSSSLRLGRWPIQLTFPASSEASSPILTPTSANTSGMLWSSKTPSKLLEADESGSSLFSTPDSSQKDNLRWIDSNTLNLLNSTASSSSPSESPKLLLFGKPHSSGSVNWKSKSNTDYQAVELTDAMTDESLASISLSSFDTSSKDNIDTSSDYMDGNKTLGAQVGCLVDLDASFTNDEQAIEEDDATRTIRLEVKKDFQLLAATATEMPTNHAEKKNNDFTLEHSHQDFDTTQIGIDDIQAISGNQFNTTQADTTIDSPKLAQSPISTFDTGGTYPKDIDYKSEIQNKIVGLLCEIGIQTESWLKPVTPIFSQSDLAIMLSTFDSAHSSNPFAKFDSSYTQFLQDALEDLMRQGFVEALDIQSDEELQRFYRASNIASSFFGTHRPISTNQEVISQ